MRARFVWGIVIGMVLGGIFVYWLLTVFNHFPFSSQRQATSAVHTAKPTNGQAALQKNLAGMGASDQKRNAAKNPMYLSPEEMVKLYNEIISYHDLLAYMKIFLPVSLFLVLTLGATLGFYFVKSNVAEAREMLRTDLKSSEREIKNELTQTIREMTSRATAELSEAKLAYERMVVEVQERQSELVKDTGIRIDEALLRIYYNLAYAFWHQGNFRSAKSYAERDLKLLDGVLPLLSGDKHDELLKKLVKLKWFAMSDLAYYCAEHYVVDKNREDAERALELARSLPEHFGEVTEPNRISVIDNYIFTISRVDPLTNQDKQIWKDTFINYRELLKDVLLKELKDGKERFESYERFLQSLEGKKQL